MAIPLTGLEPGEWVIRVSLNGSKGDDTFGGVYSIPVIIFELSHPADGPTLCYNPPSVGL